MFKGDRKITETETYNQFLGKWHRPRDFQAI